MENNENNDTNKPTEVESIDNKKPGKALKILAITGLVVLTALITYILTTLYNNEKPVSNESQTTESTTDEPIDDSKYITSTAIGYPLSFPEQAIKTELVFPAGINVLQLDSSQNEASSFISSSNDVMGNWIFKDRKQSQNYFGATFNNMLSVVSVAEWTKFDDLKTAPSSYYGLFRDSELRVIEGSNDRATIDDKKNFIEKVKSFTSACDENSKFVISSFMNVCYRIDGPKDGGSSILQLVGYGEVNNEPLLLTGFVELNDFEGMSREELLTEFEKYAPDSNPRAKEITKNYTDALSKSTITVVNRGQ